jgi:hypothetical protein
MTRPQALAIAAMGAVMSACGLSQEGVKPPSETIAFPASAVLSRSDAKDEDGKSEDGRWLFVANSNSDLRYNDGTVVALDVKAAAADLALDVRATFPQCPDANYKDPNPLSDPRDYCCRDALDPNIINCDERRYITHPERSVRIGSFAAGMIYQRAGSISDPCRAGQALGPQDNDRLLIAVRGDTSLTWLDVDTMGDGNLPVNQQAPTLDCGGAETEFSLCTDAHRVVQAEQNKDVRLPDEPYAMALDTGIGLLYVGHLSGDAAHPGTGGISLFDVTGADRPRFLNTSGQLFSSNSNGLFGVTSLTPRKNGASFDVFATSRYVPQTSGVRTTTSCPLGAGDTFANLVLIGSGGSYNPNIGGSEIRGIQFPPVRTGQEAFVLQRSPPALVGFNGGDPTSILETCTGPTFLYRHNPGHAGERLFVNCGADGQVWVFDPAVPRLVTIFNVGRSPAGLVFAPAPDDEDAAGSHFGTTAYVVGFGDNNISVIDLTPGAATEYHVVQRLGFPRLNPR